MQDRAVVLQVDGREHVLNRYFVQVGLPRYVWGEGDPWTLFPTHPFHKQLPVRLLINTLLFRPESYSDDLELAEGLPDGEWGEFQTLLLLKEYDGYRVFANWVHFKNGTKRPN